MFLFIFWYFFVAHIEISYVIEKLLVRPIKAESKRLPTHLYNECGEMLSGASQW